MRKQTKSNNKSVRLTDEVLRYVENFEGNGFNEKFENLVLFCMSSEDQRRLELARLEERVKEKRKVLDTLTRISWTVNAMEVQVRDFQRNMETYFSDLNK